MSSCILERLSLIHTPGSIIIPLKGQLRLNTRTTEEGDLSAKRVSPFPRMSAVFWTDTQGRAQERDLCQPCGKELPCTPRCQYIAGGQSLSSHQNDQGGAPRCHRHQRTSGRFEAKPCSLLGTGAYTLARGPHTRIDTQWGTVKPSLQLGLILGVSVSSQGSCSFFPDQPPLSLTSWPQSRSPQALTCWS